jgi:hypothetical protein
MINECVLLPNTLHPAFSSSSWSIFAGQLPYDQYILLSNMLHPAFSSSSWSSFAGQLPYDQYILLSMTHSIRLSLPTRGQSLLVNFHMINISCCPTCSILLSLHPRGQSLLVNFHMTNISCCPTCSILLSLPTRGQAFAGQLPYDPAAQHASYCFLFLLVVKLCWSTSI